MYTHPVEIIYKHLTSMLAHQLGEPTETTASCPCCQRPAAEFEHTAYPNSSYGITSYLCGPCRSFFVTDIDIVGIERYAAGTTAVGHKFGMLAGTGFIHELSTGRSILLCPEGTHKKLPNSFFDRVEVQMMTTGGHLEFIAAQDFTYPILYIESFGKKTYDLISSLCYSLSPAQLVCCSDDKMRSVNRVNFTLDVTNALALKSMLDERPNASRKQFEKVIRELATAKMSPAQASDVIRACGLIPLMRLLPVDPHQRLGLLRLLKKLDK